MNLSRVNQIAKAVLYEGYMLYPYRPSSVKNQQRFNFGVLYPQAYSDAQAGQEPCSLQTECLVRDDARGDAHSVLEVRLRFLHLQTRSTRQPFDEPSAMSQSWQEAAEREVIVPTFDLEELSYQTVKPTFAFPAQVKVDDSPEGQAGASVVRWQEAIEGTIELSAKRIRADAFKITIRVRNTTPLETNGASQSKRRDQILMQSLISTHLILGVQHGEFVSLLEPLTGFEELAAQCQNTGAWPVLVGEPGQFDTLLASPIILYDYPQIAPESSGDLFDGTEIDEILSLRILTLTEEEKREIRQSDARAREILERTETMPPEQFMKLHGAVRGLRPLEENNQ
jgi:hydrogenase maturation protease